MKPDYYMMYLRGILIDLGDERANDSDFLEGRADMAAAECETARKEGDSFFVAQERAMHVLLKGLEED